MIMLLLVQTQLWLILSLHLFNICMYIVKYILERQRVLMFLFTYKCKRSLMELVGCVMLS